MTAGGPSSREVADEADDIRAGLAETLGQLRDNLRPENMVHEVVANARIGAGSITDGLYGLARENPLPALLIGAGCALAMGFGAHLSTKSPRVLDHDGSSDLPGTRLRSSLLRLKPRGPTRTADKLISPVPGAAGAAREFGTSHADLSNPSGPATQETGEAMNVIGRSALSPRGAASRLSGILNEQPLILAALGVAVGAAIGATLPHTEAEDAWLGDASSSVRHAAEEAARQEIQDIRAVATRTADNLKQNAADRGLSSGNVTGFATDADREVRRGLRDVGRSIDPAG